MVYHRAALVCGGLAPAARAWRQRVEVSYPRFSIIYDPRSQRQIERFLDKRATYEVDGNANRGPMGQVKSAAPYLQIGFEGSPLLRVRPVGSAAR